MSRKTATRPSPALAEAAPAFSGKFWHHRNIPFALFGAKVKNLTAPCAGDKIENIAIYLNPNSIAKSRMHLGSYSNMVLTIHGIMSAAKEANNDTLVAFSITGDNEPTSIVKISCFRHPDMIIEAINDRIRR